MFPRKKGERPEALLCQAAGLPMGRRETSQRLL
jgi:hypothetical protein